LEIGVERIRAHNLRQKALLSSLLPVQGADDRHGAFVTVTRPDAVALCERLKAKGVKGDARGEYLRLCPDLLNSEEELRLAARVLQEELLHPA